MTEYSFFYPRRRLSSALARRAFFTRGSRTPIAAEIEAREYSNDRDLLVVRLRSRESGALYVPNVDSSGCLFYASTSTLLSSERPRPLYLELSRGQLSLLSQKLADWHALGFRANASHYVALRRVTRRFAHLVCRDPDEPKYDLACVKLFDASCELNRRVNELFLSKVLEARRAQILPWKTRFGFCAPLEADWPSVCDPVFDVNAPKRRRVKPTEPFFSSFNPEFGWSDVETSDGNYDWSRFDASFVEASKRELDVALGPLVRWGERVPQFASGYSAEEETALLQRYINALVARANGRVKNWIVATNVESRVDFPSLETRLTLAARTAKTIRKTVRDAKAFLGFEQPFGDAAFFERHGMEPWELASKVAKRGLFDGFYLEINFGVAPNSTFPRDPMELHRFFDRWCSLGLPIFLGVSCPSASPYHSHDAATLPLASPCEFETRRSFFKFRANPEEEDYLTRSPEENEFEALWNETNQRETIRRLITSALSRRNVEAIFWTRLVDSKIVEPTAELTQEHKTKPSAFRPLRDESSDCACSFLNINIAETEMNAEISLDAERDNDPTSFDLQFEVQANALDAEEELSASNDSPNERRRASFNPRADYASTSGLFDANFNPKPILYKLAATKRSYID